MSKPAAGKRKVCRKCSKNRLLGFFHKDRAQKDGHRPYCKKCAKEIDKARRSKAKQAKQAGSSRRANGEAKVRAANKALEVANNPILDLAARLVVYMRSAGITTLYVNADENSVSYLERRDVNLGEPEA